MRRTSLLGQPAKKIQVRSSDAEAAFARDQVKVFRPLYDPRLPRDPDGPLSFAYDVFTQNNVEAQRGRPPRDGPATEWTSQAPCVA